VASSARAAGSEECLAAYEQGQVLRQDGRLRAAREKLLVCAAATCPRVTTTDCARWLAETDQSIPTIVIHATDPDARELVDVSTSLDGATLAPRADGRAVAVDPGEHVLRFERAGAPAIERRFVFREGEKDRAIAVRWEAAEKPRGGPPTAAIVLGSVAAVAAVSFAVLGIKGYADAQTLKGSCVPHCSEPAVSRVDHELLAADVSLGVAVIAAGLAAWLWLSRPSAPHTVAVTF
jgi:hypothetical protein